MTSPRLGRSERLPPTGQRSAQRLNARARDKDEADLQGMRLTGRARREQTTARCAQQTY
ncbi:MAG: hypothetical protein VYC52_03020 [Pseudomonadota bacterium]|nr:hypothetical protein [Pseudomonadota bacterium]